MPRSIYYITTSKGTILEMNATLSLNVSETADLTSYRVEDGSSHADHKVVKSPIFRLNGLISDLKLYGDERGTADFICKIQALHRNPYPFSFTWRDDKRGGATFTEHNCHFSRVGISQGSGGDTGYHAGGNVHCYAIDLEIQKIKQGRALQILVERNSFIENKTAKKETSSGSSEFKDYSSDEEKESIQRKSQDRRRSTRSQDRDTGEGRGLFEKSTTPSRGGRTGKGWGDLIGSD